MDRAIFYNVVLPLCLAVAVVAPGGCRSIDLEPGDDDESPTTIYAIQETHDDTTEPRLGSRVYLRSVLVSAYDSYPEIEQDRMQDESGEYYCLESVGYTGAVVVQEIDGGPLAGVSLFNPTLVPAHAALGAGDVVDVRGDYLEFCLAGEDYHAESYCSAQNENRLTQLGAATVTKVGELNAPEPLLISASDLLNPVVAEQYEGTLVRIDERLEIDACNPVDSNSRPNCCVGDYDRYGNLSTNRMSLTNDFYALPEGVECVTSVVGIVTWFGHESAWGDYSLSPRGPADVVVPQDCRGSSGG